MQIPHFLRRFSLRARLLWFLLSVLAGILLELAIPLPLPGGSVEQVQKIFLNLNPRDLVGKGAFSFLMVLFFGGLIGTALFVGSALLANWQPHLDHKKSSRHEWLLYSIPMGVVWGIYLLSFWPAMMSADSLDNWWQAHTWSFTNGHPLLYLLLVWFVTLPWKSPAMFMIMQILAFSLLVAWGLGKLREYGLPAWAAWLVALLFAFSPVNGAMSVTLWKDIPYSLSILWLSILILLITVDPQRWLEKKTFWLLLGSAAVFVGLMRYNGIVIPPVVFILLALVYRKYWAVFARSLAFFLVTCWLVTAPLTTLLHVQKTSLVSSSPAMLHIAAHIHYGSEINEKDKALLEQIMPLSEWHYYCYTVNSVVFNHPINNSFAIKHEPDLLLINLRLFRQHPTVDINQTFCSSSLVYRVLPPEDGYFYAAALIPNGPDTAEYLEQNDQGLKESPVLPALSSWLIRLLENTRNGNFSWLIWRPALYLYFFLFVGVVLELRAGSAKLALFLAPGFIHSAALFAMNVAQDFRYMYPVYLLGLFSLALLFLPFKKEERNLDQKASDL